MSDSSLHAFLYDPWMGVVDRAGMADRRRRLVAEARGRVLEVGGGTGRNLPLYRDVESVVVLENNAWMRQRLFPRVKAAAVPVEIHEVPVEATRFDDHSFDTIVCALVLCRVVSQAEVLTEVRRLLRPDGRLLFLEHVHAPGVRGRLQKALTPLWSRSIGGGCHLDRDTLDAIRGAGFAITDCERSGVLVQGTARISTRTAARA